MLIYLAPYIYLELRQRKAWAERLKSSSTLQSNNKMPTALPDNTELSEIFDMAKEYLPQESQLLVNQRVPAHYTKRSASVRLYNMPTNMTEENIRNLFLSFGAISDIQLGT
jgi:hypothetical protein